VLSFVCEDGSIFRPGDRHNQRLARPARTGSGVVIVYHSGSDRVVLWRGPEAEAAEVFELIKAEMRSGEWVDARELAQDNRRARGAPVLRSV